MNNQQDTASIVYDTRAHQAAHLVAEARRDYDAAHGTPTAALPAWLRLRSAERLVADQSAGVHRLTRLEVGGASGYCTCGLLAPADPAAFAEAAGHRSFHTSTPAAAYIVETTPEPEDAERRHLARCSICGERSGPLSYADAVVVVDSHRCATTTGDHA